MASKMRQYTDMTRSPEEKLSDIMPTPLSEMPDTPPGLCICLTEAELEKLDLEDECEIGDMIHISGFAKVTSISKHDSEGGKRCRIELSIVQLAVEDENDETDED